jgi:histidinol phosphatase-like PHP family hydrolase
VSLTDHQKEEPHKGMLSGEQRKKENKGKAVKKSFLDSLYFSVITGITLGFGDFEKFRVISSQENK